MHGPVPLRAVTIDMAPTTSIELANSTRPIVSRETIASPAPNRTRNAPTRPPLPTRHQPSPTSHRLRIVSRETFRWPAAALAALAALATLASACAAPPGPRGWAAPQPVVLEDQDYVLVPHKDDLFALRGENRFPQWQFPPSERGLYPISEARLGVILTLIGELYVSDSQKDELTAAAERLTLSGDSDDALKDLLKNTVSDEEARNDIEDIVDAARAIENEALDDVDGLYGDLGVSEDGATVYVPSFGGWLFALETATGETRWSVDFKDAIIGGVAVDGDMLYFGTTGEHVFAVDASSGETRWTFDADGEVWAAPALTDDAIYVTSMGGHLYKLDRDGKEQWVFDNTGAGIAGRATVDGDTVYVGSFDKKLYAVATDDGSMRWSFEGDNWFWSTPLVNGDLVYAANLDSKVYAVRADSGERAWRFDAGAPVRSAPVIAGDGLIVAARDGDVHKLDLESGQAIGGAFPLNSRMESDLTADGDEVYATPREATLFVIDASDDLGGSAVPLR